MDLSQPLPLAAAQIYHQGEPLFISLADGDQNLYPDSAETVWVQVISEITTDSELLLLTETGTDSGEFIGAIQTSGLAATNIPNGILDVTAGDHITVTYTDSTDSSDVSSGTVLVDPYGLVFNSSTGRPVDGVAITLVNAVDGQPAVVYGDDGVSAFPIVHCFREHRQRQQRQGICI